MQLQRLDSGGGRLIPATMPAVSVANLGWPYGVAPCMVPMPLPHYALAPQPYPAALAFPPHSALMLPPHKGALLCAHHAESLAGGQQL